MLFHVIHILCVCVYVTESTPKWTRNRLQVNRRNGLFITSISYISHTAYDIVFRNHMAVLVCVVAQVNVWIFLRSACPFVFLLQIYMVPAFVLILALICFCGAYKSTNLHVKWTIFDIFRNAESDYLFWLRQNKAHLCEIDGDENNIKSIVSMDACVVSHSLSIYRFDWYFHTFDIQHGCDNDDGSGSVENIANFAHTHTMPSVVQIHKSHWLFTELYRKNCLPFRKKASETKTWCLIVELQYVCTIISVFL